MAYTQILYHIIFRTKYSDKALDLEKAPELYKYMWGIIKNERLCAVQNKRNGRSYTYSL